MYELSGGSDYTLKKPYNITIPAGKTELSFNVVIINDGIFEVNENFSLIIIPESLPNDVTAGTISRSAVIIVDDDCKFNCCLIIDKLLTWKLLKW